MLFISLKKIDIGETDIDRHWRNIWKFVHRFRTHKTTIAKIILQVCDAIYQALEKISEKDERKVTISERHWWC